MSVKIMGQVWDLLLPHNKLIVLLAMADHADHDGNNVYPSLGLVAWKTGYSSRTIQRVIEELVADGILIVVEEKIGEVKKYKINLSAGTLKKPYKSSKKSNPRQNVHPTDTPTPDIAMSPLPLTQLCHPTPDTAMSPESSVKPSIKSSDIAPDKSDAIEETAKTPKAKTRDVLFDGILATAFRINPFDCTPEQLKSASGRVGKIKSKLVKINPDFKTMTDDEIRADLKAFWKWYQKQHDFDEAQLRSDDKWGEYYLQYHMTGRTSQVDSSPVSYYQANDETVTEDERQAALDALKKGDN